MLGMSPNTTRRARNPESRASSIKGNGIQCLPLPRPAKRSCTCRQTVLSLNEKSAAAFKFPRCKPTSAASSKKQKAGEPFDLLPFTHAPHCEHSTARFTSSATFAALRRSLRRPSSNLTVCQVGFNLAPTDVDIHVRSRTSLSHPAALFVHQDVQLLGPIVCI